MKMKNVSERQGTDKVVVWKLDQSWQQAPFYTSNLGIVHVSMDSSVETV